MNRRIVWYARFCGVLQAGGVLLLGLLVYSKSMGASVERVVVSGRGCRREFMTSRRSSGTHARRRQWRGARVQAASAVVARSARDPADFEVRAGMPKGSAGWNAILETPKSRSLSRTRTNSFRGRWESTCLPLLLAQLFEQGLLHAHVLAPAREYGGSILWQVNGTRHLPT